MECSIIINGWINKSWKPIFLYTVSNEGKERDLLFGLVEGEKRVSLYLVSNGKGGKVIVIYCYTVINIVEWKRKANKISRRIILLVHSKN